MDSLNSVYVHHLSPFAIQFTETFGIRWYGLAYLAGFMICYFSVDYMAKHNLILLDREKVSDFITFGAIGTLVGGRVGYAIFYSPNLLVHWSSQFPYWGVLEVHKGGMASHGGIMGIMLACWLYSKVSKVPILHLIDLCCFAGGFGIFFGRIANFINGELYGRAVETPISWAVKFPQEIFRWASQSKEKLKDLSAVVEQMDPISLKNGQVMDVTSSEWVQWIDQWDSWSRSRVYVYLENIIQQVEQGRQTLLSGLAPVLTARHPSQLYQAMMEGLLISIVLFFVWKKPQKPGVIAGIFGTLYAVMRVIGEQFRMPDAHIGYEWLGLTRGQWISFGMLVFAAGYWWISVRRESQLIGGWGNLPKTK